MEIINNYETALRIAKPYIEHLKVSISNGTDYNSNDNDVNLPLEVENKVWQMSKQALINTLKYLFYKLHHSCYMLCIMNNKYEIYKIELLDVAPTFQKAIPIPVMKERPWVHRESTIGRYDAYCLQFRASVAGRYPDCQPTHTYRFVAGRTHPVMHALWNASD